DLRMGFFFSSRRRHTRFSRDWSSDVCSSDLTGKPLRSSSSPRATIIVRVSSWAGSPVVPSTRSRKENGAYATGRSSISRAADTRSEERRVGKEGGYQGGRKGAKRKEGRRGGT